jgi:N-methylhydantoinase B/oxoprolinase/acetone carboxylase alpha subunit
MRALFSGLDGAGDRFSQVLFASGGMGASPHRDGLPTTAFPTNVGAGSIEAYESVAPLVVWKKRLRADSGGAEATDTGGDSGSSDQQASQPSSATVVAVEVERKGLGALRVDLDRGRQALKVDDMPVTA